MTARARPVRVAAFCIAVVLIAACTSGDDDDLSADDGPSVADESDFGATPLPSFRVPDGPPCEAGAAGSLLITVECVDPEIATAPYVDVDEVRSTTDPATDVTVTYRYVNGGFRETDVRFSFYFPTPGAYEGRFFQHTYPTLSEEDLGPAPIAFAIANGAYAVSSNNAGGVAASPALGGYRANAAAAKFSRVVAAELYGDDAEARGYIYGASGGAYQTVGAAENTDGVWAGAVPMVPGVPNAIPSFMSVQVLALRLLEDDWPEIVDALEPGGSGDPYATLDAPERAVLEEATRLGHPLGGWWQWETLRGGAFSLVVEAVEAVDGDYVDDFYSVPGYEGLDPEVASARVQFETTVQAIDQTDDEVALTLADAPTGFLEFADLVVTSGGAAGTTVPLVEIDRASVTLPADASPGIAVGDQVRIDNSLYLALSYYHRHSVPAPDQYGWDQFRDASGEPIGPQRPILVGELLTDVFGGIPTGHINGKMIMLASVLDVQAFPWAADWYRKVVDEVAGNAADDDYRLWYMDNADHQPPSTTEGYAHIVTYDSALQQALLDLDAWVAEGTPPPESSGYRVTDDNQIELAPTVDDRRGIQPVVTLSVNPGDECSESDQVRGDVDAGDPVAFDLSAAVPGDAGEIVRVEWDFQSMGEFADSSELDEIGPEAALCETHTYDEPGTYFAVARVTSQRQGDPESDYRLVQNLARVRVVVE